MSTDNCSPSGNDGTDGGPSKMLALEKSVTEDIQNNVRRTLAPYLSCAISRSASRRG